MKKPKKKPDSNSGIFRLLRALGIILASLIPLDIDIDRDEHPVLALFSQVFTYGFILLFIVLVVGSLLGFW